MFIFHFNFLIYHSFHTILVPFLSLYRYVRVPRRIFGPKRDEVTGEWRKLHIEELNDLYCSTTIVRVIKSRTGWAEHIARMGRGEACTEFWWGNLRE
jgi:hypothetical protein